MFCRKCGKEINNTSRFCPFCGTPVVMPAAPVPVTDPEPAAPASATVEAPAAAEVAVPVMEAPAAEAAPEAPAVETPAEAAPEAPVAEAPAEAAPEAPAAEAPAAEAPAAEAPAEAAPEAPVAEAPAEAAPEAPVAEAPAEAAPEAVPAMAAPATPVQPAPAQPTMNQAPVQPAPAQPMMNQAPVQPAPAQPMGGQPYPQPGAPVPPAYSPIPADKPEKKKKGKAGVVIAIILIVLLLAGGAAAAYFFIFASPAKKISKAIEVGNMETVTELYEKVNSEKDKDQIKSELLTYVQTLEDNYLAEEITYEDAIRTMEDLRDVVFTDGEIEDIMHMVSKIHDSRENFAKAEKLAATGTWKDYYDAIGYYEEVVSDDTLYYDKAQDAIANCKTECISAAEAEADGYIADGDYDAAVSFLEDAYYDTGYNELYDKMDQVKADMKDALLEKAIENAKAEVAAGNYTEARNIINNAKEDYGYDSRFDDVLASIPVDTSLVGKWKLEYDMNDIIAETVGEDMDNFDSEFYVTFIFEFTEDGVCRLSLDEDSFVKSFDSWKDDLLDYLIDMALEEYISDGSMTKKEFEKAFKSTYGMTIKEYFSEMLDEELDVSELLDETETEMKYYVEGDRLYLVDDTDTEDYYENFYIEGDTLVLGGDGSLSEAEILPGLSYPLQLIKVVD